MYRAYVRANDAVNNLVALDSLPEPVTGTERRDLTAQLQTQEDPDQLPVVQIGRDRHESRPTRYESICFFTYALPNFRLGLSNRFPVSLWQ